ncbi:MAG: polyphosphate kinase 1 [Verrucomicrobiales bacterium]
MPKSPQELPSPELTLGEMPFRSKEESWLSFNSRVLQEAANANVPLLERVMFLGICSSNLDEFFRVRVATLKRLTRIGKRFEKLKIPDPNVTARRVNAILQKETERFNRAYAGVMKDLRKAGVRVVTDRELPEPLHDYVREYFLTEVRPRIMPIKLKANARLQGLKDHPMYLAVRLSHKNGKGGKGHALLEIPASELPRFKVLPDHEGDQIVMYLDDIIRFGLPTLFTAMPYDHFESWAIKFTRDSEMEFDDDFTESLYEKVTEGLRARETGNPVRINYDHQMPKSVLKLLVDHLRFGEQDTLFPGARYHNRKDLMKFPRLGGPELRYPPAPPVRPPKLSGGARLFQEIRKADHLLHLPYHSFEPFLDLLREASLDPLVRSIKLTQYRLARRSCVAKAMVAAVKNGKDVTVLVEPRARFDEEANIGWANEFREAGIRVILGVPVLKVHSKLCLITRHENGKDRRYAAIGTGNFNEDTAKLYTDHLLLTAHKGITKDIDSIFDFFQAPYNPPSLKHLVAAPFNLRSQLRRWVEREIKLARAGKPARIRIKINNLSDPETVDLLYLASSHGVRIQIIARSMFSLITELNDYSENIEARSIVGRYLEHSRIFIFDNGGKPEFYISSADFLPRNFDSRFETLCPIYDPALQRQLVDYFELQWQDNVKARKLDTHLTNEYVQPSGGDPVIDCQAMFRDYVRRLSEKAVAKR